MLPNGSWPCRLVTDAGGRARDGTSAYDSTMTRSASHVIAALGCVLTRKVAGMPRRGGLPRPKASVPTAARSSTCWPPASDRTGTGSTLTRSGSTRRAIRSSCGSGPRARRRSPFIVSVGMSGWPCGPGGRAGRSMAGGTSAGCLDAGRLHRDAGLRLRGVRAGIRLIGSRRSIRHSPDRVARVTQRWRAPPPGSRRAAIVR